MKVNEWKYFQEQNKNYQKFRTKVCVLRVVNACFVCAEHDEWNII